jgi:hypothetical protein
LERDRQEKEEEQQPPSLRRNINLFQAAMYGVEPILDSRII